MLRKGLEKTDIRFPEPMRKPYGVQNAPTNTRIFRDRIFGWVGGEGGIRTHGGLAPTAVFKTAALNHSATSPDTPTRSLDFALLQGLAPLGHQFATPGASSLDVRQKRPGDSCPARRHFVNHGIARRENVALKPALPAPYLARRNVHLS